MRARIAMAWLVLLLAPTPAFAAGTVSVGGDGFVNFVAGGGETNNLSVSATIGGGNATITFTDSGATVNESETDCDKSGSTITCSGSFGGWTVKLGDKDDTATASGNLEGGIEGEDGNDTLKGSESNELQELVNGGNGEDQVMGRGGADFLVGEGGIDFVDAGPGNDTIGDAGGEGNDSLGGGDGFDVVAYTGTSLPPAPLETFAVNLAQGGGGRTNAIPETDALVAIEDVDTSGLFAPSGDDTVVGSAGSNVIRTGAGNDAINPGGSADSVFAGAGDDGIDAVDGSADRIACELGTDTVQADQFDELSECENVTIVIIAPNDADRTAPDCTVTGVKRALSRRSLFRGFTPKVACSEAATLRIRMVVNVKGGLLARVGDLVLCERTTTAGANVKVKPARRFARRLSGGRAFRVRLEVEARDQFGNRSVETKRIKVKKARKKRGSR